MDEASKSAEATNKRRSQGRQRIEIKKVEDEAKRQVTFSKRRRGLFNKAKEVSTLSGAQVAVLVLSRSGRLYSTDDADAVLHRFLLHPSAVDVNGFLAGQETDKGNYEYGCWWNQPVDNLAPTELMEYAVALRELRGKAAARLEELCIQDSRCLLPWVAQQDVNKADQFMQGYFNMHG